MLAALLWLTAVADIDPRFAAVYPAPPWISVAGETQFPASPAFGRCETLLRYMVKPTDRLADKRYAESRRWGHILRVRYIPGGGEGSDAFHLTCWVKPGHGAQFTLAPEHMFGPPPPPGHAHYRVDIIAPPAPPPRAPDTAPGR
jgi:hypothetical protein